MDMHTLLRTAMYFQRFYFRCFSTRFDIVLACQAVVTHCRLINSLLNSIRHCLLNAHLNQTSSNSLLHHELGAAFASQSSSQQASPDVSCGKRHLLGPPGTLDMWVLLIIAKPAPGMKSSGCPGAKPRRLSRNQRALAQLSESYTPYLGSGCSNAHWTTANTTYTSRPAQAKHDK